MNVLNFCVSLFVREFDFLGVEGEHVFQVAPVGQLQVHALIVHARFRPEKERFPERTQRSNCALIVRFPLFKHLVCDSLVGS